MRVKNHRFEGVEFVPTKKHGGKIEPVGIVFHYTAGWTTEGDVHTLAKSDRQVSAHLVLGRDGKWVQILPFNVKGWHAGPSRWPLKGPPKFRMLNNGFIGIEICNQGWLRKLSNGNFQSAAGTMIKPNGQFVSLKRRTPKENPPPSQWPAAKHHNVGNEEVYWEPYPDAQLEALEEGVLALLKAYPTIKYMVGHDEIDTRGWKADPGPFFPMRRMRLLAEKRGGTVLDEPAPIVVPLPKPVVEAPKPAPPPQKPWYRRWDNLKRLMGG